MKKLTIAQEKLDVAFKSIKLRELVSQHFKCNIYLRCDEKNIENYQEDDFVLILGEDRPEINEKEDCVIVCKYWEYRKENFGFYLLSSFKWMPQHSDWIKCSLKEPNNVNKLSTNKIEEWVNFLCTHYLELKEENLKREFKVTSYLHKIKKIPGVHWYKDNISGYVVKGGIEYRFSVSNVFGLGEVAEPDAK
jgi:hypothetical protein